MEEEKSKSSKPSLLAENSSPLGKQLAQALLIWMVVMLESWPVSLSFLNVVTATLHEIRDGKYLEHIFRFKLKLVGQN